MALAVEKAKAIRLEGLKREREGLSVAERVQRSLINGRPPVSEFKTPLAAIQAARTLDSMLATRLVAEGFHEEPKLWGVSVGYVTPDLSTIGFTRLYSPDRETEMFNFLSGNIALGLVFGVIDREGAKPNIVTGSRPFFTAKQTDGWLVELAQNGVRLQLESELCHIEAAERANRK